MAQPTTTILGYKAGLANGSAAVNTYIGSETGRNSTGYGNTFVGSQAGVNNQSGYANVFIGLRAGANNTTGFANLFAGQQSGSNNSTGSYNLFFGNASGAGNTIGEGNTAIGDGAAYNTTSGSNNTNIGRWAGFNSIGESNVFIGVAAGSPASMYLTNAVAIGAETLVSQSNSMVLGKNLNVGIGTSAPQNKLELVSSAANTSGLRLTNLKSTSPATILNTIKFLTVNANGDVVLGSINGSARMGIEAANANWQLDGQNLLNANEGAVLIGPGINKLPVGYRLFVSGGILTEKVKVAIANTSDWADNVLSPSYLLMPLRQVEQHIHRHGHLPGIPSAAEVVDKGVDLAQMNAQLLAKIEELTLHLISLQKQVNRQGSQLKQNQIKRKASVAF
ncbi:hypothetical protein J2I46_18650 [Fibrella sp. HMF5405]|uniref:TMF family protein n=1 Tax=Fibrella forsythiae TaxID=2817061 RepID=A0ABS3JKS6_9BACT|nr:hypothetical protein [Fibrella forsythiae]